MNPLTAREFPSAEDAISFALDEILCPGEALSFLAAWREGDLTGWLGEPEPARPFFQLKLRK